MFHYRYQGEIRQQMLFYAAGQLERVLQHPEHIYEDDSWNPEFANIAVEEITNSDPVVDPDDPDSAPILDDLEVLKVVVSGGSITTNAPEPVTLYTYRMKE